jgi:hypothetical protein
MALAVKAWNLMAGQIDFSALPFVVEYLGIQDIDLLIRQLVLIRDQPKNK